MVKELLNKYRTYAVFLMLVLTGALSAQAQEAIENDLVGDLNQIQLSIGQQQQDIAGLQSRILETDGILHEVLSNRLENGWIKLLEQGNAYAELVLAQDQEYSGLTELQNTALGILATHPAIMNVTLQELDGRIIFPGSDASPAEQAEIYNKIFSIQNRIDRILALIIESYSAQSLLGFDISVERSAFDIFLRERAINTSVYLDISVAEAEGVRAGLEALPGNADLTAELVIINNRIEKGTDILGVAVARLEASGVDVTEFREQLVTTSGKITPNLLDFGVIRSLLSRWGQALIDAVSNKGPTFLFQVLVFLLIVIGFYKLSQLVEKLTEHALTRSNVALSKLLHSMIVATSSNIVLMLGVLIALAQLGISLGPLLTGLGIAGFVIGFALQDTLSNFASGLMILFYKPFDVGDLVDLGGVFGVVDQMSLVNTTVLTLDNQRITLPNTMIWGGVIKNVTAQKTRRVDLIFGISYDDDIEKTENILNEIIDQHALILKDPEFIVRLHELGESSVNFVVRAWTKTEDYWDVYWDLLRSVKLRFDDEGISIPYPQQDVHLIQAKENS